MTLVVATGACQGFQMMSSPDATTTSFVERSGVLVYAPRSARAQKVVFDTPDKELINQRDTPMRKFFDEHAADFAPGMVDYAKTTILDDIIAMLRSKRYIGQMVGQVVDRHRETAIIAKQITNALHVARSEIRALEDELDQLAVAEKEQGGLLVEYENASDEKRQLELQLRKHIGDARETKAALEKEAAALESDDPARVTITEKLAALERTTSELTAQLTQKDALSRGRLLAAADAAKQVTLQRAKAGSALAVVHARVVSILEDADAETATDRLAVLADANAALANLLAGGSLDAADPRAGADLATNYLAALQAAALDIGGSGAPAVVDTQTDARRDLNAGLLASTITLALQRENYPDVRDQDIERVLDHFLAEPAKNAPEFAKQYRDVWMLTTPADQNSPAVQEMVQDLRSALRRRDYLDGIVDEAVRRRRDLFRSASTGPLAKSVEAATKAVMTFVRRNLGRRGDDIDWSRTPWEGFLEYESTDAGALWHPEGRQLTRDELHAFGAELRPELLGAEPEAPDSLAEAMKTCMAKEGRAGYLRGSHKDDESSEYTGGEDALDQLASRFAATFEGHQDLIRSSEPFLTALLHTDTVFQPPAGHERITTIRPRFSKRRGQRATAEAVRQALAEALYESGLRDDFGDVDILEAFKAQLANAFRHNLNGALAAERPVDYEYWWLTFYPKAVPKGTRKLEGESHIEINFPESLVPQEQYHRWLQDRSLADRNSDDEYRPGLGNMTGWEHRLRLATDVLNDFLIVLDSSDLVDRYPGMRETILTALEHFTGRTTRDLARRSVPQERYENGVKYLAEKARGDLKRNERSYVSEAEAESARGDETSMGSFEPDGRLSATLADDLRRSPARQYIDTFEGTDDPGKRRELRETAALDLAWEHFGAQHILFAVTSASETQTSLPYKVALYSSAFFDGSRRFSVQHAPHEDAFYDRYIPWGVAEFESTDTALVQLDGARKLTQLSRYLLLKGVSAPSVLYLSQQLYEGLEEQTVTQFLSVYDLAPPEERQAALEFLFKGTTYRDPRLRSAYLADPPLWPWEMQLDSVREELRFILVNLYSTSYPGVPDPERIKSEFRKDDRRLQALVYQLVRDLHVWAKAEKVLEEPDYEELFVFDDDQTPEDESDFTDEQRAVRDRVVDQRRRRFLVQLNLLFDRHDYLTDDSIAHLREALARGQSIDQWMHAITEHQPLMDQFSEHLLEKLYEPLFDACRRLNETQRHPIPFKDVAEGHYKDFRYWSKPEVQKGIQVIDLLPMSRDDLVSLSITEGGVIAEAAAQVEGAATYDAAKYSAGGQVAERAIAALDRDSGSEETADRGAPTSDESDTGLPAGVADPTDAGIERVLRQKTRQRDAKSVLSSSQLDTDLDSQGTQIGGAAKGSLFARAKSAMAFAKRREYLDAAITAAGRGDNFARWVIRRSDVRSDLAGTDAKNNVAAAHTGFPNGDQPFHLLVKVPLNAMQTDWDGQRYILFNSAYAATARQSWYDEIGTLGLLAKIPLYPIYPRSWDAMEQSPVGTVYPFKFDAKSGGDQVNLMTNPNVLGGRIYLDSTDKVKHSDVLALIEAESEFVKLTRSAQSSTLKKVLDANETQATGFRETVAEHMDTERSRIRERTTTERTNSGVATAETALGARMTDMEKQVTELEAAQKKAATDRQAAAAEPKAATAGPGQAGAGGDSELDEARAETEAAARENELADERLKKAELEANTAELERKTAEAERKKSDEERRKREEEQKADEAPPPPEDP